MNHLEFAAAEAAALEPTEWERWVELAERIAGHNLDGDQSEDGYCLDYAYVAWKAGRTPAQYVATFRP